MSEWCTVPHGLGESEVRFFPLRTHLYICIYFPRSYYYSTGYYYTTVTTCGEMQLVPIPSPYNIARVCRWGRILFPIPFERVRCVTNSTTRPRRTSSAACDCDRQNCVRRTFITKIDAHPRLGRLSYAIVVVVQFFVSFVRPLTAMWDKDIT